MSKEDYNCFNCEGLEYQSDCEGDNYESLPGKKICCWYTTAQSDLRKYEEAKLTNEEPLLTLSHMLIKYIGDDK